MFTAGVQRALTSTIVVDAAYVGTRGNHFRMTRTYNEPDRVTGLRPNPNLSQASYVDDSQRTTYNSLQTSMRQRVTNKLQANVNYTWSSTRSNYDGDNTLSSVNDASQTNQDFFDIESSWGPVIGDVRHSFIGSLIYETPSASNTSSVVRHIFASWQAVGHLPDADRRTADRDAVIVKAGSRPDVIDLANVYVSSCCDIGNNVMQYLNPAAFQQVPLNAISRQPAGPATSASASSGRRLQNLDLSVGKAIRHRRPAAHRGSAPTF